MSLVVATIVITLWHATQGAEKDALDETIARVNRAAAGRLEVRALSIPFDAFARKVETTVPSGHGPDLFLAAHDRLGDWVATGIVAPLEPPADTPATLRAGVSRDAVSYGIPVGYKALLLYWNRKLLDAPPSRVEDLEKLAPALRARSVFPLAYDATSFFFHAPFFLASGGKVFDGDRIAIFDSPASWERVGRLRKAGALPSETSSVLAQQLFNGRRAAAVMSGPWFAGDVTLPKDEWSVAPLFEGHGSFVTVDALFLAATCPEKEKAREAARLLREVWVAPPGSEELRRAQERAMTNGLVTPSRPEMSLVWDPAQGLLRDVLERDVPVDVALARARHALAVIGRPDPPAADPRPFEVGGSLALVALAMLAVRRARATQALARARRPDSRFAFALVLPSFIAMLALIVAPFVAGAFVSFFAYKGNERTFVGLRNFEQILLSTDQPATEPGSFWFVLAVTVLWTVANVALHVTIGVALALLLRRPWLALRGAYRVLLVLPWAVPSYITALVWRGLFDRELGGINALLRALGHEPVSWFTKFSTAFAANVTTNTWLGFPFMMVVTLGALQGIPPELEEVARLEGASRWQTFRMVVLPAIRPALGPAVVLGSVWTFNMFNVIYLVSGGEPAGSTEILISEAYKWAFVRQHRYGTAAAYAVLIFGILLLASRFSKDEKA